MNKSNKKLSDIIFKKTYFSVVLVMILLFTFILIRDKINTKILEKKISILSSELDLKFFKNNSQLEINKLKEFIDNSMNSKKKYVKSNIKKFKKILKSNNYSTKLSLKKFQIYAKQCKGTFNNYIFVFDTNGVEQVNPVQQQSIKKSLFEIPEINNDIKKIIKKINLEDSGYICYNWYYQKNNKTKWGNKISYIEKFNNNLLFGSGMYIEDLIKKWRNNKNPNSVKLQPKEYINQKYNISKLTNDTIFSYKDTLIFISPFHSSFFIQKSNKVIKAQFKNLFLSFLDKELYSNTISLIMIFMLILIFLYAFLKKIINLISTSFTLLQDKILNSAINFKTLNEDEINIVEIKKVAMVINKLFNKQKKLELSLIQEKEQLNMTLLSITDSIIVVNNNARIKLINYSTEKFFKIKQSNAKDMYINDLIIANDIISNNRIDLGKEILINKINQSSSVNLKIKDKIIEVNMNVSPIFNSWGELLGAIIIIKDMTELISLEKEIAKSQNLDSLGLLAGGIAHDFNNMLSGIAINLAMLKKHFKQNPYPKADKWLELASKSISNAKHLTNQLLTFSKGGTPVKQNSSIATILKESVDFILTGSDIVSTINISMKDKKIMIDPIQITQITHNLIINARDAIKSNGKIDISMNEIKISQDKLINSLKIKKGQYVEIVIEDNGPGISKDVIRKIFEPYFTTKATGNGLGLATVYSIIKKHNGAIEVKSEIDKGTKFTIYLPIEYNNDDKIQDKNNLIESTQNRLNENYKKNAFVIDDDEIIRTSLSEYISELGFNVLSFANSKDTLKAFDELYNKGEKLDLALVDIVLHDEIDGHKLFAKLYKTDNKIFGIACTGFSKSDILSNYKNYGFSEFLKKPYTIKELENILNKNNLL